MTPTITADETAQIAGRGCAAASVAISPAPFRKQHRNPGVAEIVEPAERGHSPTIDHGWDGVAGVALGFVQRFLAP